VGIGSQYFSAFAAVSGSGTSYTADQVYALLLRSHTESFSFDWLNQERIYQGDLTPYVVEDSLPQLSYDSTQAVPRTLTFRTRGKPAKLNPLTDLVRVHFRVLAPDGGWLDWTIATLALSQPRKSIREGWTLYDWTASDLTNWLVTDEFTQSYSLQGGTDAIAGAKTVLGSFRGPTLAVLIPGSSRSLSLRDSLSWDRGRSRLQAIDDVFQAVSYRPVWPDEWGDLRSEEIPDYNFELPSFTWDATAGNSVVLSTDAGLQEQPDPANAVNFCAVVGEDPRAHLPIYAEHENTSPDSPVSTVALQRRLVKVVVDSKIADYASAKIRARAEVQAGARIFGKFTILTSAWPAWADGGYPLVRLTHSGADEGTQDWTYLVLGWSWTLAPGEVMTHTLQRVVAV